jgi:hypothetical protein
MKDQRAPFGALGELDKFFSADADVPRTAWTSASWRWNAIEPKLSVDHSFRD